MGWAGAAANVVGALGGALIGRSGQNAQYKAQERATNAQLAFQREQEQGRQNRYNQAYGDYQREKAQYDQIRRSLLESHYGIKLPGVEASPGAPQGAALPGVNLGQLMGGGGGQANTGVVGPVQAGGLGPAGPAGPEGPEQANAQSGGDVFDWRNYLHGV